MDWSKTCAVRSTTSLKTLKPTADPQQVELLYTDAYIPECE